MDKMKEGVSALMGALLAARTALNNLIESADSSQNGATLAKEASQDWQCLTEMVIRYKGRLPVPPADRRKS